MGNEIIPCIYEKAGNFSEGIVGVIKEGKWGAIDKKGNEIISFKYDKIMSFSEGLAAVQKDGQWYLLKKTN